jgi:putative membrane protein
MQMTQVQVPAFRQVSNGRAVAVVLALSVAALALLGWLLLRNKPTLGRAWDLTAALPAVNASLNGLSAVLLCCGLLAIRRANVSAHLRFMIAAFVSSSLFLVCYLVYHYVHGHTTFAGRGAIRPVYFAVLISHTVLSGVALPLILITFFLSLSGRFPLHRRVARYTFPIWLYVSVTGVAVFAMLKIYNG